MRHWVFKWRGKDVQTVSADDVVAFPITVFAECHRTGRTFERWDWDAAEWIADLAGARVDGAARIDAVRVRLTDAGPVSPLDREYAAKRREAEQPGGPRPYLDREAELRGEPIEATCARVLARSRAADQANAARAADVSAIAVVAKEAVRAATSADEIETIAAVAIEQMAITNSQQKDD